MSCGLPERSCFPLGALVLRNSCLLLSSLTSFALSSPLFFLTSLKADSFSPGTHLAPCSFQKKKKKNLPSPHDFPSDPRPHAGSVQKAKVWEQRAQLSASFQDPGLSLPHCSSLLPLCLSSGLRSRSLLGHREDRCGCLAGTLGLARRLPLGCAVPSADPPRCPCLQFSCHLASAALSSPSLWNPL